MVIGALAAWGSRHAYTRSKLVDAESGQEVRLGYFRADTGERVAGRSVSVHRRPRRPAAPPRPRTWRPAVSEREPAARAAARTIGP